MKFIEQEWALVNKKTGHLYRSTYGNKGIITYASREDARMDKSFAINAGEDFKVERVRVVYSTIGGS